MAKYRLSSKCDQIVHSMILSITNMEEKEEKFKLTKRLVLNQLTEQRYMDVDSHSVKRCLDGIVLKLKIHSQHYKAKRLKELSDQFLNSHYLRNKGDLKWGILSFLLCLGQHPASDYLPQYTEDDLIEDSVHIPNTSDWTQELMKRSFQVCEKDDTLSDWSEDESKNVNNFFQDSVIERKSKSTRDINFEGNKLEFTMKFSDTCHRRNSLLRDSYLASYWINANIQSPYWNCDSLSSLQVVNGENNRSDAKICEYSVMRECLWTLLAPSTGFIFKFDGCDFFINSINLPSLPNKLLEQLLSPICKAASKLHSLRKWLLTSSSTSTYQSRPACAVLPAYSEGLRYWIDHFCTKIVELEEDIFLQTSTRTLLWLLNELDPLLSKLSLIYEIHSRAFFSDLSKDIDPGLKLISLLICGIESGHSSLDRSCLLVLLKFTLRNHFRGLHSILWHSNSFFEVYLPLFGIYKKDVKNKDSNEVESVYEVDSGICFELRGLKFLRVIQQLLIDVCRLRDVVKDLDLSVEVDSHYLEDLVYNEIDKRLMAKSSSDINPEIKICFPQAGSTEASTYQTNISCSEVVKSLVCEKKDTSIESNLDVEDMLIVDFEAAKLGTTKDLCQPKATLTESYKTLEEVYFDRAFRSNNSNVPTSKTFDDFFGSETSIQNVNGLEYLLSGILRPIILTRYTEISKEVLETLVVKHGLVRQLKMFKAVFILDPIAKMNDFYSYLFHIIDDEEVVSGIELTQVLQECVSSYNNEWALSYGISVDTTVKWSISSPFQFFHSIHINKIDLWPLSLILNSTIQEKYNRLFVFCLLLRRASFSLEQLRFKELGNFGSCYTNTSFDEESNDPEIFPLPVSESVPLSQRIHQLQLLRRWLLYLVGILHDHFIASVILPFSIQIDELISTLKFDDFKQKHSELLDEVCKSCLLSQSVSPFQKIFNHVFSTVENVRTLWLGSPDKIHQEKLDELQDQYCTCHRLIGECFTAFSENQFVPLVESMAQSLLYNRPV